jgi:hypothetical protein
MALLGSDPVDAAPPFGIGAMHVAACLPCVTVLPRAVIRKGPAPL